MTRSRLFAGQYTFHLRCQSVIAACKFVETGGELETAGDRAVNLVHRRAAGEDMNNIIACRDV